MPNKFRKETRSFIKSVLRVSHIDFSKFDMNSRSLVYSSGQAANVLGYTPEELLEYSKNNSQAIIHPDDFDRANDQLRRLRESAPGEIVEMIIRYRRKDGRYIWGYTREMVSEWDDEGNPVKVTIIGEDISELVSIQMELEDKVKELEKMSFRGHHDLRGSVASILGLTNLIKDEKLVSKHNREILDHLTRTVTKLDTVVRDILQEKEDDR